MMTDVRYFRAAFLRHTSQRLALMLTPTEARRRDQKYDERRSPITDVMIARHLAGEIALAAPAAVGSCAHLLAHDVDAGGLADERRGSLLPWKNRDGKLKCKRLSEHYSCPLAGQKRDPFGVY